MNRPKLDLAGEEHFAVSPDRLYERLTNIDLVAANIPDLESSERVDDRRLHCVVRPGVSFLRGTLKLDIEIDPLEPPRQAQMRVEAQGIGAKMQIVSNMQVEPADGGATLHWQAQLAKASGLVATVSPALIQAAAQRVLEGAWSDIREELEEGGSAAQT